MGQEWEYDYRGIINRVELPLIEKTDLRGYFIICIAIDIMVTHPMTIENPLKESSYEFFICVLGSGFWELIYNPNFKPIDFDGFRNLHP
jgi:hypothetical protein